MFISSKYINYKKFFITVLSWKNIVLTFDTYEEALEEYENLNKSYNKSGIDAFTILATIAQYGNNKDILIGLQTSANPFKQEYQDLKDIIRDNIVICSHCSYIQTEYEVYSDMWACDKCKSFNPIKKEKVKNMNLLEAFKKSDDIVHTALTWKDAVKLTFNVTFFHDGTEHQSIMTETEAEKLLKMVELSEDGSIGHVVIETSEDIAMIYYMFDIVPDNVKIGKHRLIDFGLYVGIES